ncbi:methylated-DNA--protein-cysteine methyltransferase [Actinorhabdospora filicis]|uniref:methylated-DNA--[protein]-cysteine S-methyltransferase n=1 Tax=Actinorhabdospora filicis TaxID=1785913 RepID=A0A9W6WCN9_9ACTN|nr:methylated-DNA--[protein]-cysteine S-methyltransferase [Actinorhabdospora filicis]GLZ79985.1 methylated-DNA--protein-cysteine methyltransferase [Actinorhabdospora filicis]
MAVYTIIDSPLGELTLTATTAGLSSLSMPGQKNPVSIEGMTRDDAAFTEAVRQLREYFAGERTTFELAYDVSGSEFQTRIWDALDAIPHGTTVSYGRLAASIGLPRERVQALGAAVGANPLLLVRPCHRVIGADGAMRGYAAGIPRKEWLLGHEGAIQPTLI